MFIIIRLAYSLVCSWERENTNCNAFWSATNFPFLDIFRKHRRLRGVKHVRTHAHTFYCIVRAKQTIFTDTNDLWRTCTCCNGSCSWIFFLSSFLTLFIRLFYIGLHAKMNISRPYAMHASCNSGANVSRRKGSRRKYCAKINLMAINQSRFCLTKCRTCIQICWSLNTEFWVCVMCIPKLFIVFESVLPNAGVIRAVEIQFPDFVVVCFFAICRELIAIHSLLLCGWYVICGWRSFCSIVPIQMFVFITNNCSCIFYFSLTKLIN